MDTERFEFSDYVNSLWLRRRLILAIWIPTVLLTLVLALGLPSKFGSTATFQLKTDLNDHARGDNYADRYISGLTGTVLGLTRAARRVELSSTLSAVQERSDGSAKGAAERRQVEMTTQKILDPQSGLERNINTGFTVSYANSDPEVAKRVADWLADAYILVGRRAAAAQAINESRFTPPRPTSSAPRSRQPRGALQSSNRRTSTGCQIRPRPT